MHYKPAKDDDDHHEDDGVLDTQNADCWLVFYFYLTGYFLFQSLPMSRISLNIDQIVFALLLITIVPEPQNVQ